MPMDPRVTLWLGLMRSLYTETTVLEGIAKPMPWKSIRLREDGCIDANHFAIHIQQRTAGVAGVDRRIGLYEVLELAARTGSMVRCLAEIMPAVTVARRQTDFRSL